MAFKTPSYSFSFAQPKSPIERITPQLLIEGGGIMRDGVTRRLVSVLVVFAGVVFAAYAVLAQSPAKQDKDQTSGKGVGFVLSADATAQDVGLPIYPGAQRLKDSSDDSSALQMGLWGGSSGFKLVVLKLESDDSVDRIAAFYRKALARYGKVVDCSTLSANQKKSDSQHGFELDCENDHPAAGGLAFKAGTKRNQHIVAVEPDDRKRTKISLVYLWVPDPEKKPN
jgi:hypothetical protein